MSEVSKARRMALRPIEGDLRRLGYTPLNFDVRPATTNWSSVKNPRRRLACHKLALRASAGLRQ